MLLYYYYVLCYSMREDRDSGCYCFPKHLVGGLIKTSMDKEEFFFGSFFLRLLFICSHSINDDRSFEAIAQVVSDANEKFFFVFFLYKTN